MNHLKYNIKVFLASLFPKRKKHKMIKNLITPEHLDELSNELNYLNAVIANAMARRHYFTANVDTYERQARETALNNLKLRKATLEFEIDAIANNL
jgi:hypothetical protein